MKEFLIAAGLSLAVAPFASGQCEPIESSRYYASDYEPGDSFGSSVDMSDTMLAVGAPYKDRARGAAYIYDRTSGLQIHELVADVPMVNSSFGWAVAISGDRAIVGARTEDDDLGNNDVGAAYVFDLNTGQQLHRLTASDGNAYDQFGEAVAIDGNIAVVGAPYTTNSNVGAVYVFDVDTGEQLFKLVPNNPESSGELFGGAVAIEGNLILVGATGKTAGAGEAYLFDATTGIKLHRWTASDRQVGDRFGSAVALSDGYAIISAKFRQRDPVPASGAVYLFDLASGTEYSRIDPWEETDAFGGSLAAHAGIVVAGDTSAGGQTEAYAFAIPSGDPLCVLRPALPQGVDHFGYAVATYAGEAYVGLPFRDDLSDPDDRCGAAYLYTIPPSGWTCPAAMNNDCQLDFFDLQTFLTAFAAHDPSGDFNDDAAFDFFDVQDYLNAYSAGCP